MFSDIPRFMRNTQVASRALKVTGTAASGIGSVIMDESHFGSIPVQFFESGKYESLEDQVDASRYATELDAASCAGFHLIPAGLLDSIPGTGVFQPQMMGSWEKSVPEMGSPKGKAIFQPQSESEYERLRSEAIGRIKERQKEVKPDPLKEFKQLRGEAVDEVCKLLGTYTVTAVFEKLKDIEKKYSGQLARMEDHLLRSNQQVEIYESQLIDARHKVMEKDGVIQELLEKVRLVKGSHKGNPKLVVLARIMSELGIEIDINTPGIYAEVIEMIGEAFKAKEDLATMTVLHELQSVEPDDKK